MSRRQEVIDYFKKKGTYNKYKQDGSLEGRIERGVQMIKEKERAAYRQAVGKAHKIGSSKYLQEKVASDIVKDDFPYFETRAADNPDLNVNTDLLRVVQSIGQDLAGEPSLTISSGKRGKARTLNQLDIELSQFNNLSSAQKEAIKPLLLRGSWEDHLQNNYKFTDLVSAKQELNNLVNQGVLDQNEAEALLSSDYSSGKLKQARKEFGGFKSAHVPRSQDSLAKGQKIDIPYSSLNPERVNNLLSNLRQVPGIEVIDEPNKGVIDIQLTGDAKEAMDAIQSIRESREPETQQEWNREAKEPTSQQEWNKESMMSPLENFQSSGKRPEKEEVKQQSIQKMHIARQHNFGLYK